MGKYGRKNDSSEEADGATAVVLHSLADMGIKPVDVGFLSEFGVLSFEERGVIASARRDAKPLRLQRLDEKDKYSVRVDVTQGRMFKRGLEFRFFWTCPTQEPFLET